MYNLARMMATYKTAIGWITLADVTAVIPVKATGAEVDTGTDDAKFMTPKAIEDSLYVKAAYADAKVSDAVYGAGWNGDTAIAPSKNAVYDKIEAVIAGAYVHPNHSGDVTSVGDGAQTIAVGAVTLAKQADMATASLVYRKTAGAGVPEIQTLATLKTDLGLTGTNSGDDAVNSLYSGLDAAKQPLDTQLTDLAGLAYAGNTLKVVRVNAGETSFELATPSAGDVVGPASATDNAIVRYNGTTGKLVQDSGVTIGDTGTLTCAAGTNFFASIKLTPGLLLLTAEVGAIEIDSDCIYACVDIYNRGVIPIEHIIRSNATRTFTSNTNQQAIWDSPTNGQLNLETGTYLFEGLIAMTAMSGTSGNGKFSLLGAGTATLDDILWQAAGNDVLAEGTAAATGGSWHIIATQTAVNIVTAGAATALCFTVKGTFTVTVAGTIIPSFAQTTAAAAVVSIGSYFKCNKIGDANVVSVGYWT